MVARSLCLKNKLVSSAKIIKCASSEVLTRSLIHNMNNRDKGCPLCDGAIYKNREIVGIDDAQSYRILLAYYL